MSSAGTITYEGQLLNDKFHGIGSFNFADGRCYVGPWRVGKMIHDGEMTWKDGSKYKGQFHRNMRHGDGTMTWPDQSQYRGQWSEGSQDGIGTWVDAAGKETKSTWKKGEPSDAKGGDKKKADGEQKVVDDAPSLNGLTSNGEVSVRLLREHVDPELLQRLS